MAALPGNIYWKIRDKKGSFIFAGCNENVAKLTGLGCCSEIEGKTDFDFFSEEIAKKLRIADEKVYSTGHELTLEEAGINIEGNPAIYLTIKKPLYNKAGKIIGIIGVSQDITILKNQEKALAEALEKSEAANNAKTVFVSSVSHDMRTPLTGILGALELIKIEANQTPKLEQLYLGAKKCGETLLNMINRVMDFAQREYTGLTVHKEKVNLKQLAIDCLNMYEVTAKKKGIKLTLDYKAPEFFDTDFYRLQEILLNLIGNAVKFTEQGGVDVKIEGTHKALKIIVQDTGVGIPADMHEAVFERFTRVHRSDRSKYPGYGLGLAKVKTSVDALDGEIILTSEPGKGSVFELYIGV